MKKDNEIDYRQYTNSLQLDYPFEIRWIQDGDYISAAIPEIGTIFSGKGIDEIKALAKSAIAAWINHNLSNHMNGEPYGNAADVKVMTAKEFYAQSKTANVYDNIEQYAQYRLNLAKQNNIWTLKKN